MADSGWPATSGPGDELGEGGGSAGEPAGREREPGYLLSTGPCTRIWPAFIRAICRRRKLRFFVRLLLEPSLALPLTRLVVEIVAHYSSCK